MIIFLLVSAALVIGCVVFHGYTLQTIAKFLIQEKDFCFYRIGILITSAILAHLFEIVFFVFGYLWLTSIDPTSTINGAGELEWQDLFYFSAATYTSTGYGDLTPSGNLRLFSTIEALTGLIMIAWTASFTFLVMQRYWSEIENELTS